MPPVAGDAAFGQDEGADQGDARGHEDPAPERPVFGLAEHEREDEREHGRGEQGQPGQVEGAAGLALAVRQGQGADGQQGHADGHVDQEHRPPARAEQVRADQQAADQLADHHAAGQHGGVGAHRAGPGRPGVGALDQAEYLRDHHRGTRPLNEAQRDQLTGRAGQAAAERGQREQDEPAQEHAPVAGDVAEPGAGHQQDRIGDDVAGHHQLQARAGGVQAGVDRGSGDVDDGRVEHGHELADEDDGQDETGTHPAFAAGQQAGAGVTGQDVGHALSLASVLSRYQDTTYPGTDTTWQPTSRAGRMEAAAG